MCYYILLITFIENKNCTFFKEDKMKERDSIKQLKSIVNKIENHNYNIKEVLELLKQIIKNEDKYNSCSGLCYQCNQGEFEKSVMEFHTTVVDIKIGI
jgi:uncharacterized membrane protein YjjP (DUF1212 family)